MAVRYLNKARDLFTCPWTDERYRFADVCYGIPLIAQCLCKFGRATQNGSRSTPPIRLPQSLVPDNRFLSSWVRYLRVLVSRIKFLTKPAPSLRGKSRSQMLTSVLMKKILIHHERGHKDRAPRPKITNLTPLASI